MATFSGLDLLALDSFRPLLGKKIGLVCNQATVTKDLYHVLDLLLPMHKSGQLTIQIVMGPQHGLFGHTQDNMIEWEGATDPRTGLRIASLYGQHRKPTPEMLDGVDLLVVDLPDIGSRYYTFIWTTALCMQACQEKSIPVWVLDRPNPIGAIQFEGTVLDPAYASFVGLYPLPTRHGMTLGEIAAYLRATQFPKCDLTVKEVEGWARSDYNFDIDTPWVMPSPNMPTVDTALVYPGGCLLEGTNLSEGRGTTRPFETFGAPFLRGHALADALNILDLPGVYFRPIQFQPTFQKHAEQLCEGCFVHVPDPRAFEPVLTYVAILQEVRRQAGDKFAWNPPPYEYETEKLPIDILAGNGW
ncbi:MAG TPA: DUF1343 domain-containing protein, partial [Fimbriimonas sp.]|nr:DUF1343 domain-containing protein [Fimbriimonas sp.]